MSEVLWKLARNQTNFSPALFRKFKENLLKFSAVCVANANKLRKMIQIYIAFIFLRIKRPNKNFLFYDKQQQLIMGMGEFSSNFSFCGKAERKQKQKLFPSTYFYDQHFEFKLKAVNVTKLSLSSFWIPLTKSRRVQSTSFVCVWLLIGINV